MFQEEGKNGVSFFISCQALLHSSFNGRVQMWLRTSYPPFTEKYNFVLKLFVSLRDTLWPLGSCTLLELFFFLFFCLPWLSRAFYTKLSRSSKHCSFLCAYVSSIDLNVSSNLYSLSFLALRKRREGAELDTQIFKFIHVLPAWFNTWKNKGTCATCIWIWLFSDMVIVVNVKIPIRSKIVS